MSGEDKIERALGKDAGLEQVSEGLSAARAKVDDFIATHKDEVLKAKSERDTLLAEEKALEDASAQDAEKEASELKVTEAEAARLRERLATLEDREKTLRQLTALHNFSESFQQRLAGRDLKELATELSSLRTVADDLPKRDGRTGRLTAVARAVKPAVRKLTGQLKTRINAVISHHVEVAAAGIVVRVPKEGAAGKKGRKAGDGGCAGVLFPALDALEMLREGDGAEGGRAEGGGKEVLDRQLAGVEQLLAAAFEGKKMEASETEREEGEDRVFELQVKVCGDQGGSEEGGSGARLGVLEAVAGFVVKRMWGDGEVGGGGQWGDAGREGLWGILRKGLAGVVMGGAPAGCHAFKQYHEEVAPVGDKWAKKMRGLGLGTADAGGEEVRGVIRGLGRNFVEGRAEHFLERVRAAVKGAAGDPRKFMQGVQRVGGGGRGVLMGAMGLPGLDVSGCALEVLATLEAMVAEAEGSWDLGKGQEVVKGLRRELLGATRGAVDVYLAVTESTMAGAARELNYVAVILHNDCMLLADALLPLQVRWRRVMEGRGAGAGGHVGLEGCLVDLASDLRREGGGYLAGVVERVSRRLGELLEGEGGGLRGMHSAGAREEAEAAVEQATGLIETLGAKILWPDAPKTPPAVPLLVYRRVIGGLVDCWYQLLIATVLGMHDIPAVQIQPLQEVLGKAKCEAVLKRGEEKLSAAAVRSYVRSKEKLSMLIDLLDLSLADIRNLNASNALSAFSVEEVKGLLRALFAQSDKLDQALQAVEQERGHERGG